MSKSVIIGDGGLSKEIAYHLKKNDLFANFLGFIGFDQKHGNTLYDQFKVVEKYNKSTIIDVLKGLDVNEIYIGISNNHFRQQIFEDLKEGGFQFPNLIDKSVFFDDSNHIGVGNLILHGSHLTCNIKIGDFNIFNGMVGIGHDVTILDYNYFGPSSNISGEVKIGSLNSFHLKSGIIQNRRVGDNNTINMYSAVINHLKNDTKMFGIPAIKIRK